MAHILETDPTMLSPLNWGGYDITNPNHFMQPIDETSASPGWVAEKAARIVLTQALNMVYQGNQFREKPIVPAREGLTVGESLGVGSIVILENELLHHSVRRLVAGQAEATVGGNSVPIGEQFTSYWRNNIDRHDDLGREHMHFPGTGTLYSRFLHWGAVVQAKSGNMTIVNYDFDDAVLVDGQVRLPRKDSSTRSSQPLPVDVGQNRTAYVRDTEHGGQVIYRVTSLREIEVYPQHDDFRKKHPERTPVERIRQKLRDLAESWQPTPVPGF